MKRTRYQYGRVEPSPRANRPNVWVYRWGEQNPDGKSSRKSVIVGSATEYPTQAHALRAAEMHSSRSIRIKIRSRKALGRANTTVRCILSSFATIATPAVGATTKETAYWLSHPQNRQWPSGPFVILKMPRSLVASRGLRC